MIDIILKFLLLVSPIAYLGGISLNGFDQRFFHIGVIGLFIGSLYDKPIRELPGKKIIIALLGICLFNIFLHRLDIIVMNQALNIFLAVIALKIIVEYCQDPKEYYKYIVWAGMINLIVVSFQYIGFNPILATEHKFISESGGLMGNSPRLTNYLAVILPFMLNASFLLFLVCLAISIISTEYSLLAIGLIILFLKSMDKNYKYNLTIIIGALIGMAMFRNSIITSVMIRANIWKEVLTGFFTQPLVGYGLGVFPYRQANILPGRDAVIFNSYLTFITGVGLLGAIWLGYVLRLFIKKFKNEFATITVLSLLCLAFIEYPFEIERLKFTIIALIAFYIIKIKEAKCE